MKKQRDWPIQDQIPNTDEKTTVLGARNGTSSSSRISEKGASPTQQRERERERDEEVLRDKRVGVTRRLELQACGNVTERTLKSEFRFQVKRVRGHVACRQVSSLRLLE